MDLNNIDSVGSSSSDMMELVARMEASRETTALLLDSFLGGFLNKLFVQKWHLYGWKVHNPRLALDMIMLLMLIVFAFLLKANPHEAATDVQLRYLFVAMLSGMVLLLGVEIRTAMLYWQSIAKYYVGIDEDGDGISDEGPWARIRDQTKQLFAFLRGHNTHFFYLSYVCTFVGCGLQTLTSPISDDGSYYDMSYDGDASLEGNVTAAARRALRSGGGVATTTARVIYIPEGYFPAGDDVDETSGVLWLFLSLAIFLNFPHLAYSLFTPYESFNTLLITIETILKRDLRVFLVLFGFFIAQFYVSLYVLFPRAGAAYIAQVGPFNSWYASFKSMVELAITGSTAEIDLDANWSELSKSQIFDLYLFLCGYTFFAVLTAVLMLNLLVAMLSSTYEMVRDESTLQSRTSFAQLMMRHELLAASWGISANVGESKGNGKFTFDFRSVAAISTDGGRASVYDVTDPFADKKEKGPLALLEAKFDELTRLVRGVEEKVDKAQAMPTPLVAAQNNLGGTFRLSKAKGAAGGAATAGGCERGGSCPKVRQTAQTALVVGRLGGKGWAKRK